MTIETTLDEVPTSEEEAFGEVERHKCPECHSWADLDLYYYEDGEGYGHYSCGCGDNEWGVFEFKVVYVEE